MIVQRAGSSERVVACSLQLLRTGALRLHAPTLSVREAQWHFATGCAAASSGGGRAFNRLPCAAADRAQAHRREDNGRVIELMQRGGSLEWSDHAPAFGLLPSAARGLGA